VKNTAVRATGEIVGKVASFVLFAVMAREVGPADLGTYVFGLAWAEVVITPVGLGIDRYLLRRVAGERSALNDLFWNALALKLVRGLVLAGLTVVAVFVLDFGDERKVAVCVLTLGVLAETLSQTHVSVFNAFERGELVATAVAVQRLLAAALGLAALAAGYGVAAVSVAFLAGALVRLALSFALLDRRLETPPLALPRAARLEIRRRSLAFTAQDLFGLVVARADVLLLSLLSSSRAVGLYGAAYRLYEATTFILQSLSGAFNAMYTYLGPDTSPTVSSVFERSIKLCLFLLVPIALTFGLLAEPLCVAFFGEELRGAAASLRLLAPTVVLGGILALSTGLIVSRRNPVVIVRIVAATAAANLGLNLLLIPPLGGEGAALAMLLSALVYAAPALAIATRTVGGIDWIRMLAAPLGAGLAMAGPLLLLSGSWPLATAAGAAVYLAAFAALERLISPGDLDFALGLVTRRLGRRRAAAA
jgi:O-antigen/teichoic acid export membrane protein